MIHTQRGLAINDIPYSGKLSREKTFADLGSFAKVFFANIACVRKSIARIRESFLHEILMLVDSRKFSPLKLSRYTVRRNVTRNKQLFSTIFKILCYEDITNKASNGSINIPLQH